MAWSETSVMDERMKFIAMVVEGSAPVSELCARAGISRKTGYKWIGRYRAEGPGGLADRARAPLKHGRATDPGIAGPRNFCAYAPRLPGCVAVGVTRAHTIREMRDAIALHLEGMAEDGLRVPGPPIRARRRLAQARLRTLPPYTDEDAVPPELSPSAKSACAGCLSAPPPPPSLRRAGR
jgi:predicted RNase H-like HicB family nuclease